MSVHHNRTSAANGMPRAPIMHDVARLAGVSHQTVSRVLNGADNVRPATRDRVLEAMRQLNYRPNAAARALVSRRSHTVGVVCFDTRLHGPASTLLAIEQAGRLAGYSVTLSSLAVLDGSAIRAAVDRLEQQSVDGIIVIAPNESAASAVQQLATSIPLVAVEAGGSGGVPVVSVDQHRGAVLAVEHLLALGHRTVWHVAGPRDWLEAAERVEGWRSCLTGAGIAAPPLISGDWSPRSGYAAGVQIAEETDATAVFVANDQMALGLLYALHERSVRVPQDVSVVGFDDIPEASYLIPPLTTVSQDFNELGRQGLQLLVDLIDQSAGERPQPPPRLAPGLVIRASTGPRSARPRRSGKGRGAAREPVDVLGIGRGEADETSGAS